MLTEDKGLVWIMIFFCLPETLKSTKVVEQAVNAETGTTSEMPTRPPLSRTSTREVVQQRSKKYAKFARMLFLDPLKIIVYLKHPPVFLSIYYASVTFGSLYVLNISITYTFEREPYNYTTLVVGLLYIPNSIGYIVSSLLGGRWMDYIMKREAVKARRTSQDGKLIYLPEDRMRENAWVGAIIYPAALIWYGWTAEKGVFWLAPVSHPRDVRSNELTRGCDTDDCQLFLWCGLHADFRYGDDYAHGIHAQTLELRSGVEQLDPEHLLMCWRHCWSASDRRHWEWMVVHYSWAVGLFERLGHLGNEKIWATMARKA